MFLNQYMKNIFRMILTVVILTTSPLFSQHKSPIVITKTNNLSIGQKFDTGIKQQSEIIKYQVPQKIRDDSLNEKTSSYQEVITQRTRFSKTFFDSKKRRAKMQIFTSPIHYKSENGSWHKRDRSIKKNKDDRYQLKTGYYSVNFSPITTGKSHVKFDMHGSTDQSLTMTITRMGFMDRKGQQFYPLENIHESEGQVEGLRMIYNNVFSGIDLVYSPEQHRLKEEFIVNQAGRNAIPDPRNFGLNPNNTIIVFETMFDVGHGLEMNAEIDNYIKEIKNNSRFLLDENESVSFASLKKKSLFKMGPSIAYHSDFVKNKKNKTKPIKVWRKLEVRENGNYLLTGAPYYWFKNEAAGTLIIDPSLSLHPDCFLGIDTFVDEGSPDGNHGAMDHLWIGPGDPDYPLEKRGLLYFNLSNYLHGKPQVISAKLKIYQEEDHVVNTSFTIEAHRMLQNWTAGLGEYPGYYDSNDPDIGCNWYFANEAQNITWGGYDGSEHYMAENVDYNSSVLSSTLINSTYGWKEWNIFNAVQHWLAYPEENHGIVLLTVAADLPKNVFAYFMTSEYFNGDNCYPPTLEIEYETRLLAKYEYNAAGQPVIVEYSDNLVMQREYNNHRSWLENINYNTALDGLSLNLTLDNQTVTGVQNEEALLTIEAGPYYTIESGADVTLTAGDRIRLLPGFTAKPGSKLRVQIDESFIDENIFKFVIDEYDKVGNINKVSYQYPNESFQTMEFSYDDLYRLTEYKYNGTRERTYSYDPNGNILHMGSKTFSYATGKNQLIADGSRTFTFDNTGRANTLKFNQVPQYVYNMNYDIFNNMIRYSGFGKTGEYGYDNANIRLYKKEYNDGYQANTYYINNGLNTLAEFDKNGDLQSEYLYGLNGMIAKYNPVEDKYYWYIKDHLGSTRMILDEEGLEHQRRDYYPFGEIIFASGNETHYQFTGKERDNLTEFNYFGARYYDAEIGRWMCVDPLADKYPFLSPYNYVANNPLSNFDPDGKAIFKLQTGKELTPQQAEKEGYQAIDKYYSGKNAEIDFYGEYAPLSDFNRMRKDYGVIGALTMMASGGQDPLHGASFTSLNLGGTITYDTGTEFGEKTDNTMYIETGQGHIRQPIEAVDNLTLGTTSTGDYVIKLNFSTSKGFTVISLVNTVSKLNNILSKHGLILVQHKGARKGSVFHTIEKIEEDEENNGE